MQLQPRRHGGPLSPPARLLAPGQVQIYDVNSNRWSAGADLPYSAGSGNTALIGGKVYFCGGILQSTGAPPAWGPCAGAAACLLLPAACSRERAQGREGAPSMPPLPCAPAPLLPQTTPRTGASGTIL